MKEETERISNEREIFFASMSHELRNPLNSLLGCIELLKDSNKDVRESLLETAQVCSETLLNLIGNILDASKIRNNKLQLANSSVDLKDSLTKIINMMKSLAQNKGIFLKVKFEKRFPIYVEYDFNKFNQVVINLIGNAIKFTEKGGIFVLISWTPILGQNLNPPDDPVFKHLLKTSSRERVIESVDGKNTMNGYLNPILNLERESDDEGIDKTQFDKYEESESL
jgi:light-regulated signal transduction histidine kinase (bacteriophytochrome)